MNQRLQNLTHWLQEHDIDVAFLTSTQNVFYLSKFYCEPHERLLGLFIFPESEPILICPKMEEHQARNAGWMHEVIGYSDTDNIWSLISKKFEKRGIHVHTAAIEKEHLNVERYENLQSLFRNAHFIAAEAKLHELRLIKDEQELTILRQAAYMADYAIEIGVGEIAEGKTELTILAAIETELKKKGIQQMAFNTMVLTGTNSALPHGVPGANRIQRGDFVLFDLGVIIDGYCSDITRTVAFGNVTEEQKRIYDTVRDAQQKAIDMCKPGVPFDTIDRAARSHIEQAGYGNFFPHRLGHGLGISVHEYPSVTDANTTPLQEGMVFTIEPGIYVPAIGGVRIEDDVYVTKQGTEILTKYPKQLQIIKK